MSYQSGEHLPLVPPDQWDRMVSGQIPLSPASLYPTLPNSWVRHPGYCYHCYIDHYPFSCPYLKEAMMPLSNLAEGESKMAHGTLNLKTGHMPTPPATANPDYYPQQAEALRDAAREIVALVVRKDQTYRGAWKKRGGTGAFHQGIGRVWDRIEGQMEANGYDIFEVLEKEEAQGVLGHDGTVSGALDDLIGYGLLLKAWIALRKPYRPSPADSYKLCTAQPPIIENFNKAPIIDHTVENSEAPRPTSSPSVPVAKRTRCENCGSANCKCLKDTVSLCSHHD